MKIKVEIGMIGEDIKHKMIEPHDIRSGQECLRQ